MNLFLLTGEKRTTFTDPEPNGPTDVPLTTSTDTEEIYAPSNCDGRSDGHIEKALEGWPFLGA